MSSQGIIHQSTCPYTPHQNGIAEGKNHHLVEIACTLLLHANVPFHFWGDVVLIACYLINHMPSSILQNQVPYSILYPKESLYKISSHIFGFTCFVMILLQGKTC